MLSGCFIHAVYPVRPNCHVGEFTIRECVMLKQAYTKEI